MRDIVRLLRASPADYILFNAAYVDYADKTLGFFRHNGPPGTMINFEFDAEKIKLHFNKHMLAMRFIRRSFIGDIRFPVNVTHEDIFFDFLLLQRLPKVYYCNECFYRYFFYNPTSITNTMDIKKCKEVLWVYEELFRIFEDQNEHIAREFAKIALYNLLPRMIYFEMQNLDRSDCRILFLESSEFVFRFGESLTPSFLNPIATDSIHKILLKLIGLRLTGSAYWIARFYVLFKSVYDALGRFRNSARIFKPS